MSESCEVTEVTKKKGIPAWWVTIFLFWLGWIFMYADRTVLNPVMGELEKEFGLSGTQLGILNSREKGPITVHSTAFLPSKSLKNIARSAAQSSIAAWPSVLRWD